DDLGIAAGEDVDFFTEAAFFSGAGADAVVFGPGDIAQAHTAEEWVRVAELVDVAHAYARIIGGESRSL
ncbi:MAG TPA: M20/M25/M40 family metallo-hydrolase, partial [Myxococcota bacterium]